MEDILNIKITFTLSILTLVSLLAVSCGGNRGVDVAVIVALTQTAAALEQQSALPTAANGPTQQSPVQNPTAESVPSVNSGSQQDYTPMNTDDCSTLNAALSASAGIQGEVTPSMAFNDYVNSKSGSGCQINFVATGQTFSNFTGLSQPVEATLVSLGWQQDARYGAGGYATAYAKSKNLCLLVVESAPSDSSLCPGNEPFTVCWDRLTPEQKIFNLTLNCAQANFP